jgi:hypothetical protein
MASAVDTKLVSPAHYSSTSTPVLDVFRPLPRQPKDNLGAGEYFLISSLVILALLGLPAPRAVMDVISSYGSAWAFWAAILIVPLTGLAVASAAHEAGHLCVGLLAGFRLVQIKLGPWRFGKQASGQEPHWGEVLPLGLTVLEPRTAQNKNLQSRLLLVLLGGPLGNVSLALLLEASLHFTRSQFQVAFGVHGFAAFSVLLGIASLLPDVNSRGNFSDGARLLMLLKNNPQAERWVSIIQMQSTLNQGKSLRDWDQASVIHATTSNDDSRDAVVAHWLAYLWAVERQDITLATKYLEEVLESLGFAPAGLRDLIYLEAAKFQAWFRDNPTKARFWVRQTRSRKIPRLQQTQLDIALLWAEGKLFDAWEQMEGYFGVLRELPASPGRDLAEKNAIEWKRQMESRMLTRAWRSMYSLAQEMQPAVLEASLSLSE